MDEIVVKISETELIWEEQVVYRQPNKAESLTWSLFKDGMRALTLKRGAEQTELPILLTTINQARFLPPDAGDDLPTLLWAYEFELIEFRFIDFFAGEGLAPPCRRFPGRCRRRVRVRRPEEHR